MKYIITDGKRYLHKKPNNQIVFVEDRSLATELTNYSAKNILNNQVAKGLRKLFRIEEVKKQEIKENDPDIEEVSMCDSVEQWLNRIQGVNGLQEEAAERKEKLIQCLSMIDRELSDIDHYIEFSKLNAYQAWRAYSMRKDRLLERRSIKDELSIVSAIAGSPEVEKMEKTVSSITGLVTNRKYRPRILTELFEKVTT